MRTTITIDEDVAARLEAEQRRSGRSFKETVNDLLRAGLASVQRPKGRKPFRVTARAMGTRPGVELDNIGALLEQVEGARHG